MTHRQSGTAASVAIGLGEDHAGQRQGFMEGLGSIGGVLAGHGVDDEQGFLRRTDTVKSLYLVHHVGIDMQAAGGIDDHHIMELDLGVLEGRLGDRHRLLRGVGGEEVDVDFTGQRLELVDGGRTIDVGGDHQHFLLFALAQIAGELGH